MPRRIRSRARRAMRTSTTTRRTRFARQSPRWGFGDPLRPRSDFAMRVPPDVASKSAARRSARGARLDQWTQVERFAHRVARADPTECAGAAAHNAIGSFLVEKGISSAVSVHVCDVTRGDWPTMDHRRSGADGALVATL